MVWTMPKVFGTGNAKQSPVVSLWVTNGFVQAVLIFTYYYSATYTALL